MYSGNMPVHVNLGPEGRALREEVERQTRVSGAASGKHAEMVDGLFDAVTSGSGVNIVDNPTVPPDSASVDYSGFVNAGSQSMQDRTVADPRIRTAQQDLQNPGVVRNAGVRPAGQARYGYGQPVDQYPQYDYGPPPPPTQPGIVASPNQIRAIQKWPALVEFLGMDDDTSTKIASKIMTECNILMIDKIEKNSKDLNKYAGVCKADNQNIKQYFMGEEEKDSKTWACIVTASGPFRGDEAVYFDRGARSAHVLRTVMVNVAEIEGQEKLEKRAMDVTRDFNVIYEYGESDKTPTEAQQTEELKQSENTE